MSQLDLLSAEPRREKQQRHVPASSRLTYQAEQGRIGKRAEAVKTWLEMFDGEWASMHPTSAELTYWVAGLAATHSQPPSTDDLLYVRRGLSDLQKSGVAEHAGTRSCRVSGKQATTWRLKTR
jgi:hypothetical protein